MSKNTSEELWVYLDDPCFGPLQKIGSLFRGERNSIRFSYTPEWLKKSNSFPLDPKLDLSEGAFFPQGSNFGVFMDSCPDRWGQILMKRREALDAKEAGRKPKTLDAWDFLLGVQDCTRMGALRFCLPNKNGFLADEALSAPPITKISELQSIAFELSKKNQENPDKLREWLKVLVAPGSSLGGARPKANLIDEQDCLWIAKFPAADDDYDVALWEILLHQIAKNCGIQVPDAKVLKIGKGYHTFLVKRFDRMGGSRKFFASAMTMTEHLDSEDASYLELAEFISNWGNPETIETDLTELFTRVVFNVASANRDDHLRNHGFIRSPMGWQLAPAFDMNPSFKKKEHSLAIDQYNREPDLDIVLTSAPYYRLQKNEAQTIIEKVLLAISNWEAIATQYGITRQEIIEARGLFIT